MKLLPQVKKMLDELDASLLKLFEVPATWVPARYRGKRKMVSLEAVWKKYQKRQAKVKPEREVTVKFSKDRTTMKGTAMRIAAVESYREDVAAGRPIEFAVNEDKQYNAMLAFAKMALANGMLTVEDFESDDIAA